MVGPCKCLWGEIVTERQREQGWGENLTHEREKRLYRGGQRHPSDSIIWNLGKWHCGCGGSPGYRPRKEVRGFCINRLDQ